MWSKLSGRASEADSRAGSSVGASRRTKDKDKDKDRDERPIMAVRRRASDKGEGREKRKKSRRDEDGSSRRSRRTEEEGDWSSDEEDDEEGTARGEVRTYSYPVEDLESVASYATAQSRRPERERAQRRDTADEHDRQKEERRRRDKEKEKETESDAGKRKTSKDESSARKSSRQAAVVVEEAEPRSRAAEDGPPYAYSGKNAASGAYPSTAPSAPYDPAPYGPGSSQAPATHPQQHIPMTGAAAEYYNDTTPVAPSQPAGVMGSAPPLQSQSFQTSTAANEFNANAQASGIYYAHPGAVEPKQDHKTDKKDRVSSSSKHGKHSSNAGAYALGAAGVAAGAHALHQSSHDHQHSSHDRHHRSHHGSSTMTQQREQKSAMGGFVDWWRNYEDVRKMEMYTEAIGVCKYCFDPSSSITDAPRKHHYHRRSTRSTESLRKTAEAHRRSGRVDKESRYAPSNLSDEERRRGSKKGLLAAGVAGYGLAKVARDVRKRDAEDDMVSNGSRRHKHRSSGSRRSRSRSRDRHSLTSRGVVKDSRSSENVSVVADSQGGYRVERRRKHRRASASSSSSSSSSSTSSRSRKTGFFSGGLLGAAAASVLGSKSRRARSRSHSPRKVHARKHRTSSRSPERLVVRRRPSNVSRSSHESRHHGSSNLGAAAGAGVLGGLLGSAFGSGNDKRSKSKRSGGFFSFGSASSSSSDDAKRRKSDRHRTQDRNDKHRRSKDKRTDDEKINATLLGLGATAAAITAAQAGRRHGRNPSKPELVAAKHRRGDTSRGISSSKHAADDEGWESASDDGYSDSSAASYETGLAYGDSIYKGKGARKSTDSLASNGSGTWKWGWRWGNRDKKKRKSNEGLNSGMTSTAAGALAGASAVGAASAYANRPNDRDSRGSQAPMQQVWPVSTSDPNAFDVHQSTNTIQPIYTSHPSDTFPIQAPQPVVPVSSAYYTQPSPAYTTPTGPPVDFSQTFSAPAREAQHIESDREQRRRRKDPEPGIKRRDSSPAKLGRDAALVGAVATAGAAAAAVLARKKSNVSFNIQEEDAYRRERDETRRDKRSSTGSSKRDERRELERRDSEREREARAKDAAREQELLERQERERREVDRERLARQERELERERERVREEEASRQADLEREARLARLDKERDRKDRERKDAREARDAERRARRREEERGTENRDSRSDEKNERRSRTDEARSSRADDWADRKSREPDSSRADAAVAGAAAAVMAGSVIAAMKSSKGKEKKNDYDEPPSRDYRKSKPVAYDSRDVAPSHTDIAPSTDASYKEEIRRQQHEDLHDTNTVEPSYRDIVEPTTYEPAYVEVAPSGVEVDTFDDDFDPDYFKKKFARKAAAIVVSSPSSEKEMYTELQDRYEHSTVDAGTFFAPKELTEEHEEYVPKGPNADVSIAVYNAMSAPRGSPNSFGKGRSSTIDSSGHMALWPVPSLNLIEPTPPGTRASSPLPLAESSRSAPESEPSKEAESNDEKTRSRPVTREEGSEKKASSRSQSKVRWGAHETIHYEVVTPEPSTMREKSSYIDDHDLATAQAMDEIVVEEEDDRGKRRTKHKYDTVEHETSRRGASRKDSEPVYRAVSPERTPVVVQPEDVRRDVYQSPFYETVSDLTQPDKSHGFVEGEVFDETPDVERSMPGGFEDEEVIDKRSTKSKKSKRSSVDRELDEARAEAAPAINVFDYLDDNPTPDDAAKSKSSRSEPAADYFSQKSRGALTEEPQELDETVDLVSTRDQAETDDDMTSSVHTENTTATSKSDKSDSKRKAKSSKSKRDDDEKRAESKKESRKKSKRREIDELESPAKSAKSDREQSARDDVEERKRSKRRETDELESPTKSAKPDREQSARDEAEERKEARRLRREEDDDDDTRSVKSERREKRRSKHEADDDDDTRSVKSDKKEKRRSKYDKTDDNDDARSSKSERKDRSSKYDVYDDDDTRSVVSTRSSGSKRKDKDKDKEKSKSGIFGLLSRTKSDETIKSTKSKSTEADDDEDDRDRRRRKNERERDREREREREEQEAAEEQERASERRRTNDASDNDEDDNDSRTSRRDSKSSKREKREKRKSKDQESFLARRAEDEESKSVPLPVKSLIGTGIAAAALVSGLESVASKREEEPETKDQRHRSLARSSDVPLERGPDTNIDDLAVLERLPDSRSSSAASTRPSTPPPPSLVEQRASSTTKIPLRWRNSLPSPVRTAHDETGLPSPTQRRHGRAGSVDVRLSGKAPRPLVLVESSRENSPIATSARRGSWDAASAPSSARQPVFPSPQFRHSRSNSRDIPTGDELRPYFLLEKHRQSPAKEESFPELPSSRETSLSPTTRSRSASDVRVPHSLSLDTDAMARDRAREFEHTEAMHSKEHQTTISQRPFRPDPFRVSDTDQSPVANDTEKSVRGQFRQADEHGEGAVELAHVALGAALGGAVVAAASQTRDRSTDSAVNNARGEGETEGEEDDAVIARGRHQSVQRRTSTNEASDDERQPDKSEASLPADIVEDVREFSEAHIGPQPTGEDVNSTEKTSQSAREVPQGQASAKGDEQSTSNISTDEPDLWSRPGKSKGKKSKEKRQSFNWEDDADSTEPTVIDGSAPPPAPSQDTAVELIAEAADEEWEQPTKSKGKKDEKKRKAVDQSESVSPMVTDDVNSEKDAMVVDSNDREVLDDSGTAAVSDSKKDKKRLSINDIDDHASISGLSKSQSTEAADEVESAPAFSRTASLAGRKDKKKKRKSVTWDEPEATSRMFAVHDSDDPAAVNADDQIDSNAPETDDSDRTAADKVDTLQAKEDDEWTQQPKTKGKKGKKKRQVFTFDTFEDDVEPAGVNRDLDSADASVKVSETTPREDDKLSPSGSATIEEVKTKAVDDDESESVTEKESMTGTTSQKGADDAVDIDTKTPAPLDIEEQDRKLSKAERKKAKKKRKSVLPENDIVDDEPANHGEPTSSAEQAPIEKPVEDDARAIAVADATGKTLASQPENNHLDTDDVVVDDTMRGKAEVPDSVDAADDEKPATVTAEEDVTDGRPALEHNLTSSAGVAESREVEEAWSTPTEGSGKKKKNKKKQVFSWDDETNDTQEASPSDAVDNDPSNDLLETIGEGVDTRTFSVVDTTQPVVEDTDKWAVPSKAQKKKDKKKRKSATDVLDIVDSQQEGSKQDTSHSNDSGVLDTHSDKADVAHDDDLAQQAEDKAQDQAITESRALDAHSPHDNEAQINVPQETDSEFVSAKKTKGKKSKKKKQFVPREDEAEQTAAAEDAPGADTSDDIPSALQETISDDVTSIQQQDAEPVISSDKKTKGKKSRKKQVFFIEEQAPAVESSDVVEDAAREPEPQNLAETVAQDEDAEEPEAINIDRDAIANSPVSKPAATFDSEELAVDTIHVAPSIASTNSPIWDTSRGFGNDNVAENDNEAALDSATVDFADFLGASSPRKASQEIRPKKGKKGKRQSRSMSVDEPVVIDEAVDLDATKEPSRHVAPQHEESDTRGLEVSVEVDVEGAAGEDVISESVVLTQAPSESKAIEVDRQRSTVESTDKHELPTTTEQSTGALDTEAIEEPVYVTPKKGKKGKKNKKQVFGWTDDDVDEKPQVEEVVEATPESTDVSFVPMSKKSKKKKGRKLDLEDAEPSSTAIQDVQEPVAADKPVGDSQTEAGDVEAVTPRAITALDTEHATAAAVNDRASGDVAEPAVTSEDPEPVFIDEPEEFIWATTSKKKGKRSKKNAALTDRDVQVISSSADISASSTEVIPQDEALPINMSKKEKKKAKKRASMAAADVFDDGDVLPDADAHDQVRDRSPSEVKSASNVESDEAVDATAIALPAPTTQENEDLDQVSDAGDRDRELEDTIAAGLAGSGFGIADISHATDRSPPASRSGVLEEPDFDDFPEHASRKSSRRGSKRLSRTQSMDIAATARSPQSQQKLDQDEFAAVLAAGLSSSGFQSPSLKETSEVGSLGVEETHEAEITGLRTGTKTRWGSGGGSNASDRSESVERDVSVERPTAVKDVADESIENTDSTSRRRKKKRGKSAAVAAIGLASAVGVAAALHKESSVQSMPVEESSVERGRQASIKRSPPQEFVDQGSNSKRKVEFESNESAENDQNTARSVLESNWSFPPNRDSAIVMNDPETPNISLPRDTTRDSGLPETPLLPAESPGRKSVAHDHSTDSQTQDATYRSPILVQVEAAKDWDVQVTPERRREHRASEADLPEVQSRALRTPSGKTRALASPPAVESTSRDRSNAVLFQSSPSTRETRLVREHSSPTLGARSRQSYTEDRSSPVSRKERKTTSTADDDQSTRRLSTIQSESKRRVVSTPARGLNIVTSDDRPYRSMSPESHASIDDMISQKAWPSVDEDRETVGLDSVLTGANLPPLNRSRRLSSHQRSPSISSEHSLGHPARVRSPLAALERSMSPGSAISSAHPLRRIDRSRSGDLRSASRHSSDSTSPKQPTTRTVTNENANTNINAGAIAAGVGVGAALAAAAFAARSPTRRDKGKGRAADMEGIYEGVGDLPASPRSPTRPHSLRKRQSLQIVDLESRVEQLAQENRQLQDARSRLERTSCDLTGERETYMTTVRNATDALAQRDEQLRIKDEQIREIQENITNLQGEIDRLAQENARLTEQNHGIVNERVVDLQKDHDATHGKWQEALVVIAALKAQQKTMSDGMEDMIKDEVAKATADQEREIERLQAELHESMEQTSQLQVEILRIKEANDDSLVERDDDYFESACTQLCQHVQQWVLRYSKFSDTKTCRLSSEVRDDKIEARLDDTMLDGSDVDALLNDRVKRRDVFMAMVMSMIWEYVFTRYLFGLDQGQRQKLKSVEKQLTEIGPRRAVARWRAITLTLLSRREAFQSQRAQDTEAVVLEIMATLARLLPPPSHLKQQITDSLRKVMTLAVDLSIEMRTQRPEYIMLAPLRPEYDMNGDVTTKAVFNAQLMNERSGETSSNAELESQGATVKMVLFPLIVKKGDEHGEGEDELVICPAQVLVAKMPKGKKVVRVMSGAMDVDARASSVNLPVEGVPF